MLIAKCDRIPLTVVNTAGIYYKRIVVVMKRSISALISVMIALVMTICLLSGCSSEPGKQSGVVRLDDEGRDEIT